MPIYRWQCLLISLSVAVSTPPYRWQFLHLSISSASSAYILLSLQYLHRSISSSAYVSATVAVPTSLLEAARTTIGSSAHISLSVVVRIPLYDCRLFLTIGGSACLSIGGSGYKSLLVAVPTSLYWWQCKDLFMITFFYLLIAVPVSLLTAVPTSLQRWQCYISLSEAVRTSLCRWQCLHLSINGTAYVSLSTAASTFLYRWQYLSLSFSGSSAYVYLLVAVPMSLY